MSQWPAEWLIAVDLLIQYPHCCDANKPKRFMELPLEYRTHANLNAEVLA